MLGVMAEDDAAISLTGFKAMRDLLEDWEFVEDQFLEFIEPCFSIAAGKLQIMDDLESQLQVFLFSLIFRYPYSCSDKLNEHFA